MLPSLLQRHSQHHHTPQCSVSLGKLRGHLKPPPPRRHLAGNLTAVKQGVWGCRIGPDKAKFHRKGEKLKAWEEGKQGRLTWPAGSQRLGATRVVREEDGQLNRGGPGAGGEAV